MNWFQRRRLAWREVLNWFFIRRTIRKNLKNQDWEKFGLRTGYVGQIYTVISLRKEDMGEEEMVQRMKIVQKIEPMNKYLESLDLAEIVYPEIVKLPESRSWLIVYWPLWRFFSLWRLIFQIIAVIFVWLVWGWLNLSEHISTLINNI